ncbi:S66 peptidase family protein [Desulfosoma caldarium]|uniref:Muramoyltetrapeptide carboxypeptidase n=1 Tax=Desulfosoma caldarium TaxID=610254 RepID=A0A3N1VJP8_9BACT|nr:LD-carboxypeptidase [Desulfosoma caldarium]ROR03036.1 muramoyltetrapeptide carboxypeptidase [Desulfosoma caldarium]
MHGLRFRRAVTAPLRKPRRLHPGMTVSLVAPAGTFPEGTVQRVQSCLETLGYIVRPGSHVRDRYRYMAGEDAHRAHDLWQALTDPSIDAVFCLRGGYGCSRLLTRLAFSQMPEASKIFLGYSDATFLHAALESCAGWITFHGPNAVEWVDRPGDCSESLAFLEGRTPFAWSFEADQVLYPGRTCGHLVGGNLTCLTHLLGTPFAPTFEGALLFLEDKNEPPYRIDRMLVHLAQAGVFEVVRGVICGSFVDCGDPAEIRTLFREHVLSYQIPVVMDLPFGHGRWNHVLPLGASSCLDTKAQNFYFLENPFLEP